MQQIVGFSQDLHEAILNAVVDHLDIMAARPGAKVGDARLSLHLGGDGFENGADMFIGLARAAGHEAGAMAGAGFAAGHAHAEEVHLLGFKFLGAAVGVLELPQLAAASMIKITLA